MALAFTQRTALADAVDRNSYPTAAFTPSASAGILVCVLTAKSTTPDLPSLDSPSWLSGSWTQEADAVSLGSSARLTVFSGQTVASPGSAALTASYGGITQTGCIIHVSDVTGQDATDFVLQPKSAVPANGTSASLALDAALNATSSACFGAIFHRANELQAPTGGETELADSGIATPARAMSTQYEINDTTSGASWTSSVNNIIVVLEVKAAAAGSPASLIYQPGIQAALPRSLYVR